LRATFNVPLASSFCSFKIAASLSLFYLLRGPGWRKHGGVEDTKLSTNKQHTLSLFYLRVAFKFVSALFAEGKRLVQ
jgi:hypothetical protein